MRKRNSNYIKLFNYIGSKNKWLDRILPLVDSSKTLIEPFCGSGAVSLNSKNEEVIANDNNSRIIDIFNGFKDVTYDYYLHFLTKKTPLLEKTKDSYYSYREFYNSRYDSLDIRDKSLHQLMLINSCTNNMARWGKKGFNQGFGNRLFKILPRDDFDNLHHKISRITFTSTDYEVIINQYGSSNSVIFLDPPYVTLAGSYLTEFNEERITRFLDNVKSTSAQIIYTDVINKYNKELMDNPKFKWEILGGMTTTSAHKLTEKKRRETEVMFYSASIEKPKSIITLLSE